MRTLVGIIPVMIFLVLATSYRFEAGLLPDDGGFVSLRVAENLRSGQGLIFNAGERRDLSDSPLWIALLSLLTLSSAAPFLLQASGLLLGLLSLLLILYGARSRLMGAAAALFVSVDGLFMSRATSGGSEALAALYLLMLYVTLRTNPGRRRGFTERDRLLTVWAGLAALVRYEFVIIALPVALGAALRDRRRLHAWSPLAASLIGATIVLTLRWHYFRDWPAFWEPWPPNWSHFGDASRALILVLLHRPLLLLGVGIVISEWFRGRLWMGRRVGLAWGVGALLLFSLAPGAGRDLERQVAAVLPLAYLMAVEAVARGARTRFALVAALLLIVAQPGWTRARYVTDPRHDAAYVRIGQWLRTHALPGTVVGAERVGALGYYSRMKMEDVPGRISPRVANARRLLESSGIGGDDFRPMFRQEPDIVLVLPGDPVPSARIYVPSDDAVPEAIRSPYRIYRWAGSPVWREDATASADVDAD